MVAARFIGIGWYIGVCIILGVGGGIWLDDKLNTGVAFTIVGLFVGIILAFWGFHRLLLPMLKKEDN